MWCEKEIEEYLKCNLKPSRFAHSLSVRDTAVKLAKTYNCDTYKARIAGLVHDCAKNMSGQENLKLVLEKGYAVDEVSRNSPELLHGLAGAIIAKEKFEIFDEEILNAIIYHTTGKENMNLLEKIIYLADYIEPLRDFPSVDELRKVTLRNLDEGLIMSFNNTIQYVISRNQLLHFNTVKARNYEIKKRIKGEYHGK